MGQQEDVKATVRTTGESAKVGKWNSREVVLSLTGPFPLEVSLWHTEKAGINLTDWPVLFEMIPAHDVMGDAQQELKASCRTSAASPADFEQSGPWRPTLRRMVGPSR